MCGCGRRISPEESPELHVLAVDDSFVDRKVIEKLLKLSSFRVTVVESGESALQYLGLNVEKDKSDRIHSLNVNLIMTDYSMPGMTGYDLLKKIKVHAAQTSGSGTKQKLLFRPTKVNVVNDIEGKCCKSATKESSALREIPVVIMSSENILARIDRCLEEGAEEFLLKPVKLSDVKRLKEFILRGHGEDHVESSSSPPSSPDFDPSIYPIQCSLPPFKRQKLQHFDP